MSRMQYGKVLAAAALAYAAIAQAGCAPDLTQPVPPDSIRIAWHTPVPEFAEGGYPVYHHTSADAERLYVLFRGVRAYSLVTGALVWQAPPVPRAPESVVVRDGRVFTSGSQARALNAGTGAELWRFTADTDAPGISAADERAFYIGTESRRVYALDVASGQPLWWVEVLPKGDYPAVVTGIVAHGDTLYASVVEETSPTGHLKRGWIVALERQGGRILWRYVNERPNEPHDASRHAVAGRMLLVNDLNGGAFMGVDRFTGQEVWRNVGPADRFGARDVAKVVDGVAYLASNDTHLYAFDPETGRKHWTANLGGSASSSAVCGDHVFAAVGSLKMFERATGKQKAALLEDGDGYVEAGAHVISRLLSHQGRVYFLGYKGVYAVECGL